MVILSVMIATTALVAADRASDLRDVVVNYTADRGDLQREYDVPDSPDRAARLKQFYRQWQDQLRDIPFDELGQAGKIDYLLLINHINHQSRQIDLDEEAHREIEPLAPFLTAIAQLENARRRFEFVEGQAAATRLAEISGQVAERAGEGGKADGQFN